MLGIVLIVLGFLAFATGAIWFATTIVRRQPLERFLGGGGLLGLAALGLVIMVVGMLVRPGGDQAVEPSVASQADEVVALMDRVAGLAQELATTRLEVEALGQRIEDSDRRVFGLLARLDSQVDGAGRRDVPTSRVERDPAATPPTESGPAPSFGLDGPVFAHASSDLSSIERILFTVTHVADNGEAVDLAGESTVVSYFDEHGGVGNLGYSDDPLLTTGNAWGATWLSGSGVVLGPGERVEITVNLSGLSPGLSAGIEFVIAVQPSEGGPLTVSRKTPATLVALMELE